MQTQSKHNLNWRMPLMIFVLAFGLRLLFLLSASDPSGPHSKWYEGDAPIWVDWAAAIDRELAFQFNLPIHPPGVAYPLAYFYRGERQTHFTAIKIVWCAMSAASCALLYLCCLPLGNRVALIAACLCTFSFGQYVLATSLNSEAPYTLLLCAIVLLTQRLAAQGSLWWAAGLGVAHGFGNLLRPEHTLLVLMWAPILLRPMVVNRAANQPSTQTSSKAILGLGVMMLAFALTCLPWTVQASRNVRIFNTLAERQPEFDHTPLPWTDAAKERLKQLPPITQAESLAFISFIARREGLPRVNAADIDKILLREFGTIPKPLSPWVLVSNQGGLSFALANDLQSDGGFSRRLFAHPLVGNNPTFRFSFPPHVRLINDGYSVGLEQIKSDPVAWMKLVIRKLQRFFDGATQGFTALNLPLGREGDREPIDMFTARSAIEPFWQAIVLGIFVAGAVMAFSRRAARVWLLIIAYKIAVTVLFYGYARQAASIAPGFFVLAALAVDWTILRFAPNVTPTQSARWLIAGFALIIGLAIEIHGAYTVDRCRADGNLIPRTDWGEHAFQSYERVVIQRSSLE